MKLPLQGVNDYKPGLVTGMVGVEVKYDGWCTASRREHGQINIYTRGGERLDLPHLSEAVDKALPPGYFFHSELTHPDGFQAIKAAIAQKDERLQLMVFDMPSESVFVDGFDRMHYQNRKGFLYEMIDEYDSNSLLIPVHNDIKAVSEIQQFFEGLVARGYEGIVIKRLDSIYNAGKTNDWLRLKRVETQDCEIVGVEFNQKQHSYIVVDESGIRCRVRAGRVIDDEDLLGRIIEVRHQGKFDSGIMRCPTFVRFRDDKEVSDG